MEDKNIPVDDEQVLDENVEDTIAENDIEQRLKQKEQEVADYLDKLQRSMAEFDNFRKRTAKEKAGMYDEGVKDTVEKILPIIDNFERALSSVQNKSDSFYKGMEMILRQFEGILDYMGVTVIETVGSKFDPALHNAVAHVDDESYSENEIIEELQKGYTYKDKIIRCSMVRVAN